MVISNGNLLHDVLIEVLSRLPVKCLLRFRCVCKHWCALFKNPAFISKHIKNTDNRDRLFLIYTVADEEDEFSYPTDFFRFFPDETLTDLTLQDVDFLQPMLEMVGGPYHGIVCIHGTNNRLTLCNLATKESRVIPKCKIVFPRYGKLFCTNHGFGLDTISNDYKLAVIYTLWNEKRKVMFEFSRIAVYNLHTNCWRDSESFQSDHYDMDGASDSTYLDGVCYWLTCFVDSGDKVIVSLSLGDETFEEIKGPPIPPTEHVNLGTYHHSICLLLFDNTDNCFNVWVLKEKRWNKTLTVGPFLGGVLMPLGLWKKDAFFLQSTTEQLQLYDPSAQEIRDLGMQCSWLSVRIYKETLIPLKHKDDASEFFNIPWQILGVHQTDSY